MITLITGAPGAGKTAALVDLLSSIGKGRAVYVDGIPDLAVPDVDVSPLGDPHEWHNTVPDGSIIVIDEVQRVWRPRSPGSRVPADIEALETHRHKGIDLYIITQGPNLLDRNVRTLVGRHVHLRDIGVLGRYWYEWPECCEQPGTGYRSAPIRRRYRLPKRVFGQYTSASVHIKPVRRAPPALIMFVVATIGAALLAWRAVAGIQERRAGEPSTPVVSNSVADTPAPALPVAQSLPAAMPTAPAWGASGMVLIDDRTAWIPRVSTRPESAPAYDQIRQVRAHPVVAGGACMGGTCRCYTQQATDAGLSSDACRQWIQNPPFDAYTADADYWPVAPVEVVSDGAASDQVKPAPEKERMVFTKPVKTQ
ncbi:MAG: zonular occludens toxin domain-containing protein [Lautropia sp.]|nr:zonular occludens toxin domain-containing protein [Lautropia sp.]